MPLKKFRIVGGRLVDDDQGDLALHVDFLAVCAGVVVPVILGRMDAVADEDDGRVDIGGGLAGLIFCDDFRAVGKIDGRALPLERRRNFVLSSMVCTA